MKLHGNYFKNNGDGNDSSFMLVLNFNDCSNEKAQFIIDRVIDFAEKNFVSDDCYYVSVDTKRGVRYPKKLSVSAEDVDISYSVSGMILPDKKLRKSVMEAPLSWPLSGSTDDDFYKYMHDDDYNISTCNPCDDFTLTFNRTNWEQNGSFECKISVSCYSLAYCYNEITELYYNLIKSMSKKFDLFSAYIDFDGFGYGDLLYEYCYYALLEQEEVFKKLRTYPWGGYISRELIDNNNGIEAALRNNVFTEDFGNGEFFCCKCKPEKFIRSERNKIYNLLRPFLAKSYGIISLDGIIKSGFKPCVEDVHLFESFERTLYVVFSNGVSLDEIIENEDEDLYTYVKTIKL